MLDLQTDQKTDPQQEMAEDVLFNQFGAVELEPGDLYSYNANSDIYAAADIEETLGIRAPVVLQVEAGATRFMVLDLRGFPPDKHNYRNIENWHKIEADFLLINPDEWLRKHKQNGYLALTRDKTRVVGRHGDPLIPARLGLSDDRDLSREHFSIQVASNDEVLIHDLDSTQGTRVTASDHTTVASRTYASLDRLRKMEEAYKEPDKDAPYGYYYDHPIIGRHSPRLTGGVYTGGSAREAIVVDGEDETLQAVYRDLKRALAGSRIGALISKRRNHDDNAAQAKIFETVMSTVQQHLPYDGEKTDQISAEYKKDQLVSLGEFVRAGAGVCRHQGLLAGYLLERLVTDGKLNGHAKVERNTIEEYGGSHGWATFVTADGRDVIVDAAQSFVGTKKQARQQAGRWDYYLPLE